MRKNTSLDEKTKAIVNGDAGKTSHIFNLTVQCMILLSLAAITINTVTDLHPHVRILCNTIENIALVFFLSEYALRVYASEPRRNYVLSFWGIIDFLAVFPSLILTGSNSTALRALRLLRLLRILKLGRYSKALQRLASAFMKIKYDFLVFFYISAIVFFIAATGIYVFENEAQPEAFPSIPASLWWAVATLTTVGYGDTYPITAGGKIFTFIILMIGLGLVAIPAGLVAAALSDEE